MKNRTASGHAEAGWDAPIKTYAKSEAPYVMESVLTYEYDPGIKIEAPIP